MVTFWDSAQGLLTLPDPSTYDLSFPSGAQPTITQGGFFVPLEAPDDVEAVAQLGWTRLTDTELKSLRLYSKSSLLVLGEPLGLKPHGYIANLDYQPNAGQQSSAGEPLNTANVTFNLTRLEWPSLLPEFAPGTLYPTESAYGISSTGTQPALFQGELGTPTDSAGWARVRGGDVDPWGGVMPPVSGPRTQSVSWDRSPRTRFYPVHGVQANYLALRGTLLSPERGSVFFTFKPLTQS